jgi:hypothetical protein
MKLLGYDINLKTIILLCFLYSIILFNMTWTCLQASSIEIMTTQKQINGNVNQWKPIYKKQNNPSKNSLNR